MRAARRDGRVQEGHIVRRRLIIRRYGPTSFGLGILEDGAWVDHVALPPAMLQEDDATAAVHAALGCCADRRTAATPAATFPARTGDGAAASAAPAVSRLAR